MASRHIPDPLGFGTGSKQELGSPVPSKNSSVNGVQLKRTRLGMYRDNVDEMPEDESSNGQQFGLNSSSLLFGTSEKDFNSMYTQSQAATSGYYGLGGAYNSNGSLSSASAHNTVSATNTGSMGSRGAQFAGTSSRSSTQAHTSNSGSMPTNPLSTQSSVPSMTGNGMSSRSILSPSANGMGPQSQFTFNATGTSASLPMNNQPKLSRSMSVTATSQSTSNAGFSGQIRLQQNATSTGFENRPFVTQQSQPSSLESQSLDPSEFPVVGRSNGRRPQSQASATSGLASGTAPIPPRNYGIASKPRQEQEFTMVSEDFPALPSSGNFKPGMSETGDNGKLSQSMFPMNMSSSSAFGGMNLSSSVGGDSFRITGSIPIDSNHQDAHPRSSNVGVIGQRPAKGTYHSSELPAQQAPSGLQSRMGPGIQTTSDGVITNVPQGMVKDQFGLIGLLTFIRVAENEPNLVSLALGSDLTTLGLNLTSPDTLCSSFTSPFSDGPTRPQDIDFGVPEEYNTNNLIRDKLAPIKLHRYGEDLLFYLYYHSSGDLLQLAAAAELYQRDWRYHKEQKVWLTRATGMDTPLTVKNTLYETGRYYVFDVTTWRKAVHDMHIEYDQLEETPHLPKSYQGGGGGSHHSTSLTQLIF
ncbi:CCR4-NOT transcription complex subunit 2-like [Sycon ciliatum]|uniref:CCR4-NOT transcription complex subunit 2-like n=1 Tax=Sycon ciliatum TaxID=27933 RepID=UPI0031F6C201